MPSRHTLLSLTIEAITHWNPIVVIHQPLKALRKKCDRAALQCANCHMEKTHENLLYLAS